MGSLTKSFSPICSDSSLLSTNLANFYQQQFESDKQSTLLDKQESRERFPVSRLTKLPYDWDTENEQRWQQKSTYLIPTFSKDVSFLFFRNLNLLEDPLTRFIRFV